MPVDLDAILKITSPEQFSEIRIVEHLFHGFLEQGKLKDLLRKFPNYQIVETLIDEEVLKFQPLESRWKHTLLTEVNSLIDLLQFETVTELSHVVEGELNYESEEMYALTGRLNQWFRKHSIESLGSHERGFLRDFFFGIDFSHWTKWAVLMNYSNTDLKLPTILRARRNGVDFVIDGNILVYKKR